VTSPVALALTFLLVAANGFFVAAEFAIVKVRPTRLRELVAQDDRREKATLDVVDHLDVYLSACQLGITLASLALGWIGEEAFDGLLAPLLSGLGPWSSTAAHAIAAATSFVIITFLHTVLGELAPKSLAIQKTEAIALWVALPLRVFYIVMFPVIWTLNQASWLALRVLRLHRSTEEPSSPEEMRMVLSTVAMDAGTRRVMDRLFDYAHRVMKQVMTLRRDVVALDANAAWADSVAVVVAHQYSRYPLIEKVAGGERLLGYVHLKDIVAALAAPARAGDMRALVREPLRVREETPVEEVRRELQRRRVHMAVVLGARDAFVGIATLEDLLEEFVGEIQDEQDVDEVPPIRKRPDGRFDADGRVTLDVAAREVGLRVPDVTAADETIASYFAAQLGGALEPGASFVRDGFRLRALSVRDGRVARVAGEPVPPSVPPAPPDRAEREEHPHAPPHL
jgi:CBS domain containing-hemolysin-like protein